MKHIRGSLEEHKRDKDDGKMREKKNNNIKRLSDRQMRK